MAEEKEKAKDAPEEKTSKKLSLKLIIIASIVLFIGAGGFFGYSKFKKSSEASAATKKKQKVSIICPLKSFVVNLLDKRGKDDRLTLSTMKLLIKNYEQWGKTGKARKYKDILNKTPTSE